MMIPDEFDFQPPEEDLDALLDDEDALEALREMETENRPPTSKPSEPSVDEAAFEEFSADTVVKSPVAKKPRLVSNEANNTVLEDISNTAEEAPVVVTYKVPQIGERKVYRRIPLDSDYQSVTVSDGQRFYVRMKGDGVDQLAKNESVIRGRGCAGLCGVPYNLLLEQAVTEQSRIASSLSSDMDTGDSGFESGPSDDEGASKTTLWVEKFKPRSYVQLLSDDGTNRTLLHWLKLWDKVVFGREPKRPKEKMVEQEEGLEEKAKPGPTEVIDELDDNDRPQQKTAMLHGPPGLGKTTLAHVVATHAGYNVVEMNASDDRSLQAFKTKLDAATQMRSVNSSDQRPNCLVIDEIDGAPAPTINYLVALLTGKNKKGKKKADGDILQRPIICICNDLYVPALRPLRQQCLLVPFPPTSSARLAQRLSYISSREHMRTDMTALMALCEKSHNDIRSCLSTLQFFKSRGKQLKASDVHKTFVGQKDSQKSHFATWQELFQIPRQGKRKYISIVERGTEILRQEESCAALPVRFRTILHSAMSNGDYQKLLQGVFENYLAVKFKDSRFENLLNGSDWFLFFDETNQHIMHSQNYSMMGYLPYTFVASHLFFATNGRVKLAYPATENDKRMALQKSKQLVDSLICEMSPSARTFASSTPLIQDVLPCLLEIIKPNLRPVNTQLYSAKEREQLQCLVATLLAYNLNYQQERTAEGQYIYRLDPCIEDVVNFPDINRTSLPYSIKQLISHEVSKEKMRRDEPVEKMEVSVNTGKPTTTAVQSKKAEAPKELPNHLRQKLTAKEIDVKERVPVDFFGRKIKPKVETAEDVKVKKANEIIISDVWFKFKEGYNNAVRRTIRLKDLV